MDAYYINLDRQPQRRAHIEGNANVRKPDGVPHPGGRGVERTATLAQLLLHRGGYSALALERRRDQLLRLAHADTDGARLSR